MRRKRTKTHTQPIGIRTGGVRAVWCVFVSFVRPISLMLLGASIGCYGYYPPRESVLPLGREVAVNLTDSGSVVMARVVGPSATSIEGRLLADSAGSLLLSASTVRFRDGNENDWKGERISIARPLVAGTAERRFSRARTTLFGGTVAVALVALREAFGGAGFGGTGGRTSGQTSGR
jgi:hypothetical protein